MSKKKCELYKKYDSTAAETAEESRQNKYFTPLLYQGEMEIARCMDINVIIAVHR
ncbi:MAG: hypothetical protein RR446_09600 [Lachnospiraceae bacterium]